MTTWVYGSGREHVDVTCRDCGHTWDDVQVRERGTGAVYLSAHEECPVCGSGELDTSAMDELDIQQRRLEANGQGDRI